MTSRRTVLKTGLTTLGGICAAATLPRTLLAQQDASDGKADDDTWESAMGTRVVIHPVNHASLVVETPTEVVYVDPVGDTALYADLPPPNLILVTHEHGDHYDPATLAAIVENGTRLITNEAVYSMLPEPLRNLATMLGNGGEADTETLRINAVPAYNITADRTQFHPEGRDNGYIITANDMRVYIAGDTEATPEMRELVDIDIAFVPMNLPYTMGIEQAAQGVLDFGPRIVYPYHYRGQDALSDVQGFSDIVAGETDSINVVLRDWYA